MEHAREAGHLSWGTEAQAADSTHMVAEMLQLIASLRDYQYA